jgi:glutamyl/glutaminyl-tRNA synthetase
MEELIKNFRIKDVSKSPAKFDYKKLDDINKS